MRRLIFVGDSHTATFRPFSPGTLASFHPGALSADALTRPNHDLTQQVLAFLSCMNPAAGVLVLSAGEVDIRAHYWRDIPVLVSRGMPVEAVVETKVRAFIAAATGLAGHFGFPEVILWGPPASTLPGTASNVEFPTTGDNRTRNILTHLFSRTCHAIAKGGHPRFRFATLFYDMVSEDFETEPGWLDDGVHLSSRLQPVCLDRLAAVVAGNATALAENRLQRFNQLSPVVSTAPLIFPTTVPATLSHRAWISTPTAPQISFGNIPGPGFALTHDVSNRSAGEHITELVLRSSDATPA